MDLPYGPAPPLQLPLRTASENLRNTSPSGPDGHDQGCTIINRAPRNHMAHSHGVGTDAVVYANQEVPRWMGPVTCTLSHLYHPTQRTRVSSLDLKMIPFQI